MPHSISERQRRFRDKKKQLGQYEVFKAKHREEMKKNREKTKNKKELLPKKEQLALQRKRRQDVEMRVAAFRQRIKQQNQKETPAFSSARAMAMATALANRSLPSTPKRRNVQKTLSHGM